MVDYLSEEEQAEAVKNWWKENWLWIISGVALGVAILIGWQFYQRYQTTRSEAAAAAFQQYSRALTAKDSAKAAAALKELEDQYAATAYADQAHLLQARAAVEAEKFDEAATALRVVADGSKDEELAAVARLRLARVLIQQGKHDDALGLLDTAKAGGFAAQVREVRGDAYLAKGDAGKAREEYQAALSAATGASASSRAVLELKLQDLGEPTPAPELTEKPT